VLKGGVSVPSQPSGSGGGGEIVWATGSKGTPEAKAT